MTNATTPSPREKTITVEGVQIRITRMNAFEQNDVLELMAGPMASAMKAVVSAPNEKIGTLEAIGRFIQEMPADARRRVLFDYLLSPRSVQVVSGGATLPLIGDDGHGQRVVMQSALDDILSLYEIAGQVVAFNFQRFISSALSGIKAQLSAGTR